MTPGSGAAAEHARAEFRAIMAAPGHSVQIARRAVERLDRAFAEGALRRTQALDRMLADLEQVLDREDGQTLGGKSAEAARFILRAISHELDNA